MGVFPASETVPAVLRHAEERRAQQRQAEADRRAVALERYVGAVGGQAEAAEGLGVSVQAVSKSLVAARRRETGEPPLAGLLELDLLKCGAQVPSMQEWRELDPGHRRDAAVRGALVWGALASTLGRLQRETFAAAEFIAGVHTGHLDPEFPEDAAEQPSLVSDEDTLAAAEGGDRSHALTYVLSDLASTLESRVHAAWRARDWWQGQADQLNELTED
ncbi:MULTISPECIES: hypothetical protein [unclassified Streptomyces]|uniref:hypothetical protein n=1 Tax=unclassified Streptomyces TaxID=2593676 RepID=UPI00093AEB73|nr:hypothetical protein [Streptomyces sp. TSRI0281]OKI35045.1 hypothetical protein A6A29_16620 [Streptomyces sp. TSRI0281]